MRHNRVPSGQTWDSMTEGTWTQPQWGRGSGVGVFLGALTFTLPTRLHACRTTLCTFSLLGIFLGILSGPLLLVFFLPNVFVIGSLLCPPLALVLVHLKGPFQCLGRFSETPNAGLGLGKHNKGNTGLNTG